MTITRFCLTSGRLLLGGLLLAIAHVSALAQDAVAVRASWSGSEPGSMLEVDFEVPGGFYLYADKIYADAPSPIALMPVDIPEAKQKDDPYLEETVGVYDHGFTLRYAVSNAPAEGFTLVVGFQACSSELCYLPEEREIRISGGDDGVAVSQGAQAAGATAAPAMDTRDDWQDWTNRFTVAAQAAGYLDADAFIAFLERGQQGDGSESAVDVFARRGVVLSLLLILIGGIGLNLTPCVLPMIPVNIAIIGAGAAAGSRSRGFVLGLAYGCGIALVYGALGLAVVLTGARFGTLNASPVFNFSIAALFVVLALGMFDLLHIDFSRLQTRIGGGAQERGGLGMAALLGGVAALLAGACVAPVLIWVLVLATDLYQRGNPAALALPFLLGVGMGLPWPLAGAGISCLPKPGAWMNRVKIGFGVVILLAAAWYGWLGFSLLRQRAPAGREAVALAQQEAVEHDGWLTSLGAGMAEASRSGKPVVVDFWATWCKSCLHMDHTTFQNERVQEHLRDFVKVKVQAEQPRDPDTRAVLDYAGAKGLPTYIVLLPK